MASPKTRPLDEIIADVTHRPESLEVQFTSKTTVCCSGPGGALGHPRVYLNLGKDGYAECNYCDRVFIFHPSKDGELLDAQGLVALT